MSVGTDEVLDLAHNVLEHLTKAQGHFIDSWRASSGFACVALWEVRSW